MTRDTWLEAYHELLEAVQALGMPEEFGKLLAKNLHS